MGCISGDGQAMIAVRQEMLHPQREKLRVPMLRRWLLHPVRLSKPTTTAHHSSVSPVSWFFKIVVTSSSPLSLFLFFFSCSYFFHSLFSDVVQSIGQKILYPTIGVKRWTEKSLRLARKSKKRYRLHCTPSLISQHETFVHVKQQWDESGVGWGGGHHRPIHSVKKMKQICRLERKTGKDRLFSVGNDSKHFYCATHRRSNLCCWKYPKSCTGYNFCWNVGIA